MSAAKFQINYRNHIAVNLATAHPHYDEEGNTYNMGTAIMGMGRPKYVIFKVPADGSGTVVTVWSELTTKTSKMLMSEVLTRLQWGIKTFYILD